MTKFEYAATLAASLAYLLIHQQDAVGLILFDDDIRAELPPLSNQAHLRALLQCLEQARLEKPGESKALFARLAAQLQRRSVVVVISDLLTDPKELVYGMERFRYGGHEVVVMHVLDHDEREFPFLDNTLFEGLEQPEASLLVDPQALRTAYRAALGEYLETIRAACSNGRMDLLELSTTDPLDIALRGYLAARSHRIKART